MEESKNPSPISSPNEDSVDDRTSPSPSSSSSSSYGSSSSPNTVGEPSSSGDGDKEGFCGVGEGNHIHGRRESSRACSPNEKEAKRRLRLEDEDRISGLDKNLLIRILSLLPTEDAIRTGVLSKRWAYLWTLIPVLDFKHARRSTKTLSHFVSFVNKTLVLHIWPKITDFRIVLDHPCDCEGGFHLESHDLDLWIRFATRRYVEDVLLSLYDEEISLEHNLNLPQNLFSCPSLMSLFVSHLNIVPKGVVNWKYLYRLSVGYTILSEDAIGKVLSGSPLLELLDLYRCGGLDRLDLTCSTSLKTLVIKDYWNWEEYGGENEENNWLEVVAPNLKAFQVSGRFSKKCRLVNASSLVSANLDVEILRDDVDIKDEDEDVDEDEDEDVDEDEDEDEDEEDVDAADGELFVRDMLYNEESVDMLKGLLDGIGHVEDLTLGPWCYLVFVELHQCPLEHLSLLSMCKRLTINILQHREQDGIECVVRAFPNLETLIIQLIPPNIRTKYYDLEFLADMEYDGTNPWPTRVKTSECLQLHLKTVKIVDCFKCDKWGILTLAKFFLEKAMVLEKVVVEKAKSHVWANTEAVCAAVRNFVFLRYSSESAACDTGVSVASPSISQCQPSQILCIKKEKKKKKNKERSYTSLLFDDNSTAGLEMSTVNPLKKLVKCVLLDLDGTLLNTDGIVGDVLKVYLVKYGKQWDGREANKIAGKTPLEAAAAIVEDYELPCSTSELISEITPMFSTQWCNIKALAGANRLIKHLRSNGVPMALASNSPRENIETKISFQKGWKESFSVIIGGDEVRSGKPSPEIFLEAAKKLNTEPSSCLVIEDSLPGVTAGKAAQMEVVAVPSLPKQSHLYTTADEVINSLLDLRPEKWGLPPFQDWIEDTLPVEPWCIGGPVIKGLGRGSKVLGIPTANLSTEGYSALLSEHPSGVYFGWARLSTRGVFKVVMSIGWNPYFNNTEKTIEPWLLHDFDGDFYGEELHLVVVGYIRPEANFPSLEDLIAKIHEDRKVAEKALDLPLYSKYRDDQYLKSCM
ncbi:hypothetical protein FNV43_RR07658 [Rhamnella rubrinervis]|uniref:riboflavin kinase n=1 Tax=Rhamnella rubrinervis TaxID=2594499 RepID=A0A8K0HGB2_9ROSA|nr:hypothetical protein FNV43_RR07658 [Rhamnella rubrinervis]